MKKCAACGWAKSLDNFHLDNFTQDGRTACCKLCNNARVAEWRKDNPDKVKELNKKSYQNNPEKYKSNAAKWAQENPEKAKENSKRSAKRWRKKNPEKASGASKKWHQENPERAREYFLKRTYGITTKQYNSIIAKQKGLCGICEKPLGNPVKKNHPVDHNHSRSGPDSIRGVVHRECNILLGHIEKNQILLPKIADYLKRYAQDKRDEAFLAQGLSNQITDLSMVIEKEE